MPNDFAGQLALEADLMTYGTAYMRTWVDKDGKTHVQHVPLSKIARELERLDDSASDEHKFFCGQLDKESL